MCICNCMEESCILQDSHNYLLSSTVPDEVASKPFVLKLNIIINRLIDIKSFVCFILSFAVRLKITSL